MFTVSNQNGESFVYKGVCNHLYKVPSSFCVKFSKSNMPCLSVRYLPLINERDIFESGKYNIKCCFFSLFSTKSVVIRSLIHKMLVRITNSEDPDQAAPEGAV